jgi:hypothetical protein
MRVYIMGAPVGWVLHAGTGPPNIAVVATGLPDGKTTAFIGPVMSYYEHVRTNFRHLTDEEWKKAYAVAPSFRPSIVRLYLAVSTGSSFNDVQSLLTVIEDHPVTGTLPSTIVLEQKLPNPFSSSTVIMFSIPVAASGVYFYHLVAGNQRAVGKMSFVK